MRTVHETEALRPSDPVPKSMQPLNKNMRLKLIVKNPSANATPTSNSPSPEGEGAAPLSPRTASAQDQNADISNTPLTPFETSLFTPEELAMGPYALYRLLRRQLKWAEEESEALKRECEMAEAIRKSEWLAKEVLLQQVIKDEVGYHERRTAVIQSLENAEMPVGHTQCPAPFENTQNVAFTPLPGPEMFIREGRGDQAEAAAVLATLHQGS